MADSQQITNMQQQVFTITNEQIKEINTTLKDSDRVIDFISKPPLIKKTHLISAKESVNFKYEINGFDDIKMNKVNAFEDEKNNIDRILYKKNNSTKIKFSAINEKVIHDNFIMIDIYLPLLLSEALLYNYIEGINSCFDIATKLEERNPLNYNRSGIYLYRIKKFLRACALGMTFDRKWDGSEKSTGGYAVINNNSEFNIYHIFNRDAFEDFLIMNMEFEGSEYKKGNIYRDNSKYFIDLNLTIRFK